MSRNRLGESNGVRMCLPGGRLLEMIKRTRAHTTVQVASGTGDDTEESRGLIRKAAVDSIVLLKNDEGTLPLKADASVTYGLIGENFENPGNCGGGSSEVVPWYVSTPLDAVTEVLGQGNIRYEPGCDGWYTSSQLPRQLQLILSMQ